MKKVDWNATLKNIIYSHTTERVSFKVTEIEQLSAYLHELEEKLDKAQNKIIALRESNVTLTNKIYSIALEPPKVAKADKFMVLA